MPWASVPASGRGLTLSHAAYNGADQHMALAPGSKLGPYEVISLIGAGGMGEVYRARDPRLNREVAIKVLPADRLEDVDRRRRFVQEAQAASALTTSTSSRFTRSSPPTASISW
jgi:serine/threonine protein kinase